MMNKLTQIDLYNGEGYRGFGPLGLEGGTGSAISTFGNFISTIIGVITVVAIIWFVFTLFLGALGLITSGGDKTAAESSRKKIFNGLIGLVVVIAGIFIIDLAGNIFGIPNILDIGALISRLVSGGGPMNQYDSLQLVK